MKALIFFLLLLGAMPAAAQAPVASEPRQLFVIHYSPGPAWRLGRPMREQDLRAHGAYYAGLLRDGRAFAGGGYVGEDGGLAIIRAANLAEAQALLAADPAITSGVFVATLRQWAPRFHGDGPLVEGPR
jgi:uncharacterized protein YciI